MVTTIQGKTNKYQRWRIINGKYERICTEANKRQAGNDLILPVGVRP